MSDVHVGDKVRYCGPAQGDGAWTQRAGHDVIVVDVTSRGNVVVWDAVERDHWTVYPSALRVVARATYEPVAPPVPDEPTTPGTALINTATGAVYIRDGVSTSEASWMFIDSAGYRGCTGWSYLPHATLRPVMAVPDPDDAALMRRLADVTQEHPAMIRSVVAALAEQARP